MSSSRASSSSSLSRSGPSRSRSSTEVPGVAKVCESYILASPPPRPRYNQPSLIVQIQRLMPYHILPVFNIQRSAMSRPPLAAIHKKTIRPKRIPSSFAVYACDDIDHGTRTSILHASGHELKFCYASGLTWHLRTDSAGILVLAVSKTDELKTLGRWTPSSSGMTRLLPRLSSASNYHSCKAGWYFALSDGEILASLCGNRVDITPSAREVSRIGYFGRLRFQESIVLTAIYIENMHLFGSPPQLEPERRVSDEYNSSMSSLPHRPAPRGPTSKTLEKNESPLVIPIHEVDKKVGDLFKQILELSSMSDDPKNLLENKRLRLIVLIAIFLCIIYYSACDFV